MGSEVILKQLRDRPAVRRTGIRSEGAPTRREYACRVSSIKTSRRVGRRKCRHDDLYMYVGSD